jgi:hypothetical protein
MDALCDLEDVVAEDLARRTGASVMRVQHALNVTEDLDDGRPWVQDLVALNQQIKAIMGDEYQGVCARLDLLAEVTESCAAAVARQQGVDPDGGQALLSLYVDDSTKGSEGFAAWLRKADAEDAETNSRLNAAAEADDAAEVARHLIVQPRKPSACWPPSGPSRGVRRSPRGRGVSSSGRLPSKSPSARVQRRPDLPRGVGQACFFRPLKFRKRVGYAAGPPCTTCHAPVYLSRWQRESA